jgi:hypothetical protein
MILLAGGAIFMAALAAPFVFPIRKPADDEHITADEVVKVWDRLFLETQQVVASTAQQLQQLLQMGAIQESQARNIIANAIIDSLPKSQTKVCNEFGVDYDCLEEATWEFVAEGDSKVQKAVERFQALFANFAGNRDYVGKRPSSMMAQPPSNGTTAARGTGTATATGGATDLDDDADDVDISPDDLIRAAQAFFAAATNAARATTQQAKMNGINLQDPSSAAAMVQDLGAVTETLTEEALQEFGLTTASFQAAISSQAQNPKIGRALMIVQQEHMMAMQSMGLV